MRSIVGLAVAAVVSALTPAAAIAGIPHSATLVGTVTLRAADGRTFYGEGARVMLTCPADGTTRTEVADNVGAFRFLNVAVDRCLVQADVQGFASPPTNVVTAANHVSASDLHLGVAPVRVGVNAGGTIAFRESKLLSGACSSDASQGPSTKRCRRRARQD